MQVAFITVNKPFPEITLKRISGDTAQNFQVSITSSDLSDILIFENGEDWF